MRVTTRETVHTHTHTHTHIHTHTHLFPSTNVLGCFSVLGGQVEALMKKWKAGQVSRRQACDANVHDLWWSCVCVIELG